MDDLDFFREQGLEVMKTGYGWMTYSVQDGACYLENLHIDKSQRRKGKACLMFYDLCRKSKEMGFDKVYTSIETSGRIDVTRSLNLVLKNGFKYHSKDNDNLYFVKDKL